MRAVDPDVAPADAPPAPSSWWVRWFGEAALLVGTYTAYTLVRNKLGSAFVPFATAARNARQVLRLERLTGLDVELGLNRLTQHSEPLVRIAGLYYRTLHQWAVIATLVWLLARRPAAYPRLRTALLVTTVLALVGFALYPLAPPRLFPGLGFVDTVRLDPSRWANPPDPSHWHFARMATNQFAAMPSLHLAWAVWVVVAAWTAGAGRAGRSLAVVHLVITSFAVVVTANHWVVDGLAGVALLAVGLLVATRWSMDQMPAGLPARWVTLSRRWS